MARCFPFPPPGFAREDSSNEALILSIKLQRENEKAKSSDRKKEMKREKEKKKQKGKCNYAVGTEKQKLVEKLYQDDKYKAVSKAELYQDDKYKAVSKDKCCLWEEDESALLEKSSVTEEHGRPIDSKHASCSSDSTGNSSKRKRPSTPPNSLQSHGNIIRIRLSSSHKTDEPSTSGRKEQEITMPLQHREDRSTSSLYSKVVRPCSNLVRTTEASIKQKDVIVNVPQDNPNLASASNAATFQLASCLPEKIEPKVKKERLSSHEKKMLKRESQYKKLLVSWVLPVVDEGDDEQWLFGKKDEERPAKRSRVSDISISNGDSLLRCASFEMQPRANFLPDVQIYALPFTVPF